jgi:hypothetical protein
MNALIRLVCHLTPQIAGVVKSIANEVWDKVSDIL